MAGLKMGIDSSELIDDFNGLMYLINSVLRGINTVDVVKVQEVDTASKTITVLPIVKRANVNGNPIPEGPISNIKYIQWQYGKNAIQASPEVGDIGIVVVCKKDISSIGSGLVGSHREFSLSDGIYLGGLYGFNQTPEQVISFTDNGISIETTKDVTINAVNATINSSGTTNVIGSTVNLGGEGGVAVAKDGDKVMSGSTVVGTISASSTVVKTI